MVSTGVNVARWSALGLGVLYGVYHQGTISAQAKLAATNREFEQKQKLIQQAKAEYAKRNPPPKSTVAEGDVIRDPNDSRFDLEKYLNVLFEENK